MTHPVEVDLSAPKDMVLVREFDAPRELVWKCWTEPEHLAAWWGPAEFTSEVDVDIRPGGYQTITMIGPDGGRLPLVSDVCEVEKGRNLVTETQLDQLPDAWHAHFAELSGGASDGKFRLVTRVSFEDTPSGGTIVVVRQTFPAQTERDANMKMGAEQGWRESFVKLDRHLTTLVS